MKTNFKYSIPDEPKRFNFVGSSSDLSADNIPTLIPDKTLKILQAGDPEPYYKTQDIDIKEPANGIMYTEDFWNSYLGKLKDRPYPGSKKGHNLLWGERPQTDFYLIGGKLNKEKGIVSLKNYIPVDGYTTSNAGFIRDLKAGIVHFSIVAYTKDKLYLNEDGSVEKIEAIESIKGERNDAVEYGMGAMPQKVNAAGRSVNGPGKSNANSLIRSGNIDSTSSWSFSASDGNKLLGPDNDDWKNYGKWFLAVNTNQPEETKARYSYPFGKSGKIYRSAITAIRQRAGQQKDTSIFEAAGTLLESIDKKIEKSSHTEVNKMDLKELLATLQNLKTNGEININDVAKVLNIEVVTKEHQNAVQICTELGKKLNTDNVIEAVDVLLANSEKVKKDTFELLRNKKMAEVFGPEKINDKENLKRNAAEMLITKDIVTEKELDSQIEAAKKHSVVVSFSYDEADENSQLNDISGIDKSKTNKTEYSGEAVTL